LPCSAFRAGLTNAHRRRSVRDHAVRRDLGDDLSGVVYRNFTKWFLTLVSRQGILARTLRSSGWGSHGPSQSSAGEWTRAASQSELHLCPHDRSSSIR
ncbi:MAG: hypothetical protein ABI955_14925, partial [Nitrospirota bacterium]